MKFIKKKQKFYPVWVSNRRIEGYKAYIRQMPMIELYYFYILKESDLVYSSMENDVYFKDFQTCCKAAEKWIKDAIKNNRSLLGFLLFAIQDLAILNKI